MSIYCYLFVPGDSARKQEKSLSSGADALILDLEDSVAADAKLDARAQTALFLSSPAPMKRYVRLNALDTGLTEADIVATLGAGPDGYILPKCESRDDVQTTVEMIKRNDGRSDIGIIAIAPETVQTVRNLLTKDWVHPNLLGLAWGGEDLAADLGAFRNRDHTGSYHSPFLFARNAMLFAAKAAKVDAIDGIFADFRDNTGLIKESEDARDCGFASKLAIHPAQVAPIQHVFTPSDAQIEWANQVITAMQEAGNGVATLDGKMLDLPHLRTAQRILGQF
jgi:citrate lyase subunit beta / citryl-CoA lyase